MAIRHIPRADDAQMRKANELKTSLVDMAWWDRDDALDWRRARIKTLLRRRITLPHVSILDRPL